MSLDITLSYNNDGNEIDVFDANITHNITKMAEVAGIYEALWHPEKINAKKAKDLIEILTFGLEKLKRKPDYFKESNSSNGWGTYKQFVPFVEEVLEACKQYPNADLNVSI